MPAPQQPHASADFEPLRARLNAMPLCDELAFHCTDLARGSATLRMTSPQRARHADDTIPGFFLVALADAAASFALHTACSDDELLRTIDLTVHFVRAARTPALRAEATVVRRSRRVGFATASVFDSDDVLCALATGSWAIAPA
jgi:uncharacterized protein (TIGR00369 family)